MASAPFVQALLEPEAYPERVDSVELAETHISYLFFTPHHVYKVRKPVDRGFLDFSTLEQRRQDCYNELTLNRRLSPDVYLDVVEIRQDERGRYAIEGPGETIEYGVKMRRLPENYLMAHMLGRGEVTRNHIRRLALKIADFHAHAETGPEIIREGGYAAVRGNIEENLRQTAPYVGITLSQDELDDLEAYSQAYLSTRERLFHRREAGERVRDCHGDLHAAQIFLEDGIHIIDCIEFNYRFRYIDVAADLAFLAMDLDHYNRHDLSELLVETYIQASSDTELRRLMAFYKTYRACVRGKIASFLLEDPTVEEERRREVYAQARSYYDLARIYTAPVDRATLVLVAGVTGTGKSALSRELARRWRLQHVNTDEVRKELAGLSPREHRYVEYGQDIYSAEFTRWTYEEVFRRAEDILRAGSSVVLDGTFRRAGERAEAVRIAGRNGADAWVVQCTLPEQEALRRLGIRRQAGTSVSDGRTDLYRQQLAEWEPVREVPAERLISLDTRGELQDVVRQLLRDWYESLLQ